MSALCATTPGKWCHGS